MGRIAMLMAFLLWCQPVAFAADFSADVVECAARSGIDLDSPNLEAVLNACERLAFQKNDARADTGFSRLPTAGQLLSQCAAGSEPAHKAMCVLTLKSFMEGWVQGSLMAATLVLKTDQAAHAAFFSLPEEQQRPYFDSITRKVACLDDVSPQELSEALAAHIVLRPDAADAYYANVLFDVAHTTFCDRQRR